MKKSDIIEGIPVTLKIAIDFNEMKEIQTKSDMGVAQENQVKDLYLFVFDKNDRVEYKHHYKEDELAQNTGSITLPTNSVSSGQDKRIIAIANTSLASVSGLSDALDGVGEYSELQNLTANLTKEYQKSVDALDGLVLSGFFRKSDVTNDSEAGKCEIKEPQSTSNSNVTLDGKIWLRHLESKIKFEVTTENSNIVFVPKSWQVVNVPTASYVLERSADTEGSYISSNKLPFESQNIEASRSRGGAFTVYMFENRKAPISYEGKYAETYADRERQKLTQGLNGDYLYADKNAAYVVIEGSYYEYNSNGSINQSAEVKYTVHLGYAKGSTAIDKARDFNNERNMSYKYKITVSGVDAIVAEVESNEMGQPLVEQQPGAEGQVTKADQNLLFDAHYEVSSIVFSFDKVLKDRLSVIIKTPYTNGEYKMEMKNGQISESLPINGFKDFEWAKFALNNVSRNKYVDTYRDYKDAYTDKTNGLLTVKELLVKLYECAGKSNNNLWKNDEIKYTVFIDEYYYQTKPSSTASAEWREFVNADNRQMYILCDTKLSSDKQSSYTKSTIMLNQRSIKSIYNTDLSKTSLPTAWGIETVSELNEKGKSLITYGRGVDVTNYSMTNGRYNMFQLLSGIIGSKPWSNYVNSDVNKSKDVNAEYICLQRNRDLDGNGRIDADEVRWYLPATNQLVGMWIGRDALPSDARLFQGNPATINDNKKSYTSNHRLNYHFISSNGQRFWSEEGTAVGSENIFNGDDYADAINKYASKYNVRCARNLGGYDVGTPKKSDDVLDYVVPIIQNSLVTSVDLTRLNPAARRSEKKDFILFHSEHSGGTNNLPYKKFEVQSSTTTFDKNIDYQKNQLSKCPNGYRVPNQREIALIAGYATGRYDASHLGSCTYSELSYKLFIYSIINNPDITLPFVSLDEGNKTVPKARCVKDVD